jgi:hypothetical protein
MVPMKSRMRGGSDIFRTDIPTFSSRNHIIKGIKEASSGSNMLSQHFH